MSEPRRGILIAVATAAESRAFLRRARKPNGLLSIHHAVVVQTGIGRQAVMSTLADAAHPGAGGILSVGCAGALAPHLPTGTLLLPRRVRSLSGSLFEVDHAWHEQVRRAIAWQRGAVATEDLAEVGSPLLSPLEKQRVFQETGAVAVDMESAGLAQIANRRGIPFLVLRTVADTATDILPPAVLAVSTTAGDIDLLKLGGALLHRPGDVIALCRLARAFRVAARAWQAAADQAAGALGSPGKRPGPEPSADGKY